MTKNQINYLLALLTLFVLYFYFNTFYTEIKAQKRMNSLGNRSAAGMMSPSGQPFFPGARVIPAQPNPRQTLSPEVQRMVENWRAAKTGSLPVTATASAAPKQDKPPVAAKS